MHTVNNQVLTYNKSLQLVAVDESCASAPLQYLQYDRRCVNFYKNVYRSGQTRTTKKPEGACYDDLPGTFEKGSLKFIIVTYRTTEPKMFYLVLLHVVNSSISLNVKQLLEQIGGEEAVFERPQLIQATWLFNSSALL
ncbi:hypothetical protein Tsp_09691 [Trichinella spiralis]|uniref:hypothetical protein n=1 Tax=Trichinella spiralis TaxID=6334 RepID=UPI0001EFD337|nr:hypothetical protein Tsp_09691 [Trichinella spiralis]